MGLRLFCYNFFSRYLVCIFRNLLFFKYQWEMMILEENINKIRDFSFRWGFFRVQVVGSVWVFIFEICQFGLYFCYVFRESVSY